MAEERDIEYEADVPHDEASFGEKAGRVAMSTFLAASLSAALAEPPRTEEMTLPEPTPIVQVIEEEEEEDSQSEEEEEQERESRLERILRILKFLAIALAIVLSVLFAVTKGCVSCAAPLLTPDEREEQNEQAGQEGQAAQEGEAAGQEASEEQLEEAA